MNDFDYDVLQRKRLAQQARYRKNGSRSKKCNLSTDNMTKKQWKERCGEMYTYNLDKPMAWKEFKELPVTVQKEYLTSLVNRYKVNATSLGQMFGVTSCTVKRHIESNQLGLTFQVGKSMSKEERVVWETFLSGAREVQEDDAAEETENETGVTSCVVEMGKGDDAPESCDAPKSDKMTMRSFSLKFHGKIDPSMIANSILSIAGKDAFGTVEIACNF